ncbi:MAG: phenylalanine--tRNA ligase subunit alpha [Bacteroidales bacterium]|nr:phenylalanine--tRNA ligase subunit alpha [Bacteroidales bacterium]MBN2821545.1 phenylalanine--tRNA ligase subunit alpha [Bacteroidales bacterium]
MKDKINKLLSAIQEISINTTAELDEFRLKYLSKKGEINNLFNDFRNVSAEERKEVGQLINNLKQLAQDKFTTVKESLLYAQAVDVTEDYTKSSEPLNTGSRHPISQTRREIVEIFSRMGFTVAEGPEIEDDWHVFSGLNFPEEHPARDMQDTFFINKSPDILLRTHTSSVQVRTMEKNQPPIRQIFPGRVFRNEAISARSHCIFHQIEGLYIDKDVSFADLKQTLLIFAKEFFGPDTSIRLRPSFFPFTEPSAEMDVSCSICGGKGCNVCKYTGFLEILGCGMVDPNVLEASNIDSKQYTGFAFGMGIERITMLKYQIKDIRYFFENDIRFLKQFSKF